MPDATVNNNTTEQPARKEKSRLQMLVIFAIPMLLISLSYFMYYTGAFLPTGRTNKGQLILPPKSLGQMELKQGGSAFTEDSLEGRWMILVVGEERCSSTLCEQAMYQTRQAHIALGKETDRVVRGLILSGDQSASEPFKQEHPGSVWLSGNKETVLKALELDAWPAGQYFIVDPLGNIMMSYDAAQYGGDVLKDLRRLLKASKIG